MISTTTITVTIDHPSDVIFARHNIYLGEVESTLWWVDGIQRVKRKPSDEKRILGGFHYLPSLR